MAEVKGLRLAKAGASYNVSTEHIIEALKKAKFELDSNPNSKLTPEMIAVLDKEFGADKAIKQQAEISKPVEKPKKEEVEVLVVAKSVKKEEEPEVVEQELLVKNNLAPKPETSDLITAEKVTLEQLHSSDQLLEFFMGKNTPQRQEFIIANLRVEKDLVEA